MSEAEQLGLWDTDADVRRNRTITWSRMRREFRASLNTPSEFHPDSGCELKQEVCLRCGHAAYYGTLDLNHDLGHCGCPVDQDPTWSRYEKAPGFRSVYLPDGSTRSMLTEEEMLDRWDADKLPRCQCGCPFGLHRGGCWCGICHPEDCQGYEAKDPTTTH